MGEIYGVSNNLITDIAITLMNNQDFAKFVYYKKEDEQGRDILSLPDVENPIEKLHKKQVYANRRVPRVMTEGSVDVYINFEDNKRHRGNTKTTRNVTIRVSVLVHNDCLYTVNGKRDVILVDCITNILENTHLSMGIGECSVDRVLPIRDISIEFNGYDIVCKVDVFK